MDHTQTIKTIYINQDVIQTNLPTSGLITKDMFENCYGVYVMDLSSNHLFFILYIENDLRE